VASWEAQNILFFFNLGEQEWRGEAEGEADSPLSREPNTGLDPRTLGSQPELKADT